MNIYAYTYIHHNVCVVFLPSFWLPLFPTLPCLVTEHLSGTEDTVVVCRGLPTPSIRITGNTWAAVRVTSRFGFSGLLPRGALFQFPAIVFEFAVRTNCTRVGSTSLVTQHNPLFVPAFCHLPDTFYQYTHSQIQYTQALNLFRGDHNYVFC